MCFLLRHDELVKINSLVLVKLIHCIDFVASNRIFLWIFSYLKKEYLYVFLFFLHVRVKESPGTL